MSQKTIIKLQQTPELAETDDNGLLLYKHRVAGPYWELPERADYGELLLCGKYISYLSSTEERSDAPDCPLCVQLDC